MAAEPLAPGVGLTDLRFLHSSALDELFEAEIRAWRDRFAWDFAPSANLVRRFVDQRALTGYALIDGTQVVGYTYCVTDEPKGLIGDLFVMAPHRTPQNENRLLAAVVDLMMRAPGIERIETQLMLMEGEPGSWLPGRRYLRTFRRQFMVVDLDPDTDLEARNPQSVLIQPWQDRLQESAAIALAESYAGHIDGNINDQYRSVDGARRFLFNIIQYPGCGSFLSRASFVAADTATRFISGLSLASSVGVEAGHITQLCVVPRRRGAGVGAELLRCSLRALRQMGYRRCSLTVTSSNAGAVRLYERLGFRTEHQFLALVWDRF